MSQALRKATQERSFKTDPSVEQRIFLSHLSFVHFVYKYQLSCRKLLYLGLYFEISCQLACCLLTPVPLTLNSFSVNTQVCIRAYVCVCVSSTHLGMFFFFVFLFSIYSCILILFDPGQFRVYSTGDKDARFTALKSGSQSHSLYPWHWEWHDDFIHL